MTIKEIYNLAVKLGISADPRQQSRIEKLLKREKENFSSLNKEDKPFYDKARLDNPYSDTRILNGDVNQKVKRIFAGIDISVSELLLTDWLAKKGKKIDLVISHHPLGKGLAHLNEVLELQADLLADQGVPINVAESLMEKRIDEVGRQLSPGNHNRVVDASKIMNIPLMCTHTVCDNLVFDYLDNKIKKVQPEILKELMDLLLKIPEYRKAVEYGLGPKIFVGKANRRCGKIALTELTGGTSSSKDIYEKLSQAGVGTIVSMHMDEEHKEEAEKHHINVVIAGHMSSDSLGMNLFLDRLNKKGIEIIPCSGLIRVNR